MIYEPMFGAPVPITSSRSGPSPPPPVRADEAIITRARNSQTRICQNTLSLCELAIDVANQLQDAQDQLARKRAKVHSLIQDKEQLSKEKDDLMEQNRTLRNEVAHLTQQVLAQADTNAQATIDTINTSNAESPAISDTEHNDKSTHQMAG